jgi:hypothetical protein
VYIYIFGTCVKFLNIWIYISSWWILTDYLCISIFIGLLFMDNLIHIHVYHNMCLCPHMYLTPCNSYFRVFNFFRVEGYAFKHLRVCKSLLSQTLNGKKRLHCRGLWRKLWRQNLLSILLVSEFSCVCFSRTASCKGVILAKHYVWFSRHYLDFQVMMLHIGTFSKR